MIEHTADVYRVVDTPLSPDAITEAVDDAGAGGVVIFSGVVRNQTDGRPVKFLEYDAYALYLGRNARTGRERRAC